MALDPRDLAHEELDQLSLLVQNPAWDLLLIHWRKLVQSKEVVKANLLREGKDAVYLQGFIDGVTAAMKEPELASRTLRDRLTTGEFV